MFVCICNQVTDKQIRGAVEQGRVSNFNGLSSELSVGTCCGKCTSCAKKVLHDAIEDNTYQPCVLGSFIPAFSPS